VNTTFYGGVLCTRIGTPALIDVTISASTGASIHLGIATAYMDLWDNVVKVCLQNNSRLRYIYE